jgi:hypothetical protein
MPLPLNIKQLVLKYELHFQWKEVNMIIDNCNQTFRKRYGIFKITRENTSEKIFQCRPVFHWPITQYQMVYLNIT